MDRVLESESILKWRACGVICGGNLIFDYPTTGFLHTIPLAARGDPRQHHAKARARCAGRA
jgi:hypothetical protein